MDQQNGWDGGNGTLLLHDSLAGTLGFLDRKKLCFDLIVVIMYFGNIGFDINQCILVKSKRPYDSGSVRR